VPHRLLHQALLVAPERVEELLKALEGGEVAPEEKKTLTIAVGSLMDQTVAYSDSGYAIVNGVGIIEVSGGMTYKGYGWWDTSYLDIRRQFLGAISDERVSSILFLFDSPGGEVAGCFDLVDAIYAKRGVKPMISVADERCFSGAYALASATDKIYLSRTAAVGSVGVLAIHQDQSQYDKNLGVKYTAIYAGSHKNDLNPHEPLSKGMKSDIQTHIDKTYELFTSTVARNRGMTQEAVIATEAAIYTGEEAVSIGLADALLSFDQVFLKMSNDNNRRMGSMTITMQQLQEALAVLVVDNSAAVAETLSKFGFVVKAAAESTEVLTAELTALKADLEKVKAETTTALLAAKEEGLNLARIHAEEMHELCSLAGTPDLASGFIKKGLTAEAAKIAILEAKAKPNDNIRSTVGSTGNGEVNPLLADARKRAGIK